MQIQDAFKILLAGQPLTAEQAEAVFDQLLAGALDDAKIGALLALIQTRGPAPAELLGGARVMRRHVTPIPFKGRGVVIDTCGTGGAPKTFNVSTAAAIIAAAAAPGAIRVAKHGNRSRTGRGSAEVLVALGVNVDAPPDVQARCLDEAGVCFCFAIHHHPAAKHAATARKSLGFPTIFNLLGPLTNPAGATHQLMGVFDVAYVPTMARALADLGSKRAMVVHSRDGMDELTTTSPSTVATVDNGTVTISEFDPASVGLAPARFADLAARDLPHAAQIIRDILDGTPGPTRDISILGAGAALHVAGLATDIASGVLAAGHAIDSGAARATLATLARVSKG